MFDFTKNDFSQLFKSSAFSAKQFIERFYDVVWKKTPPIDVAEISTNDEEEVIAVTVAEKDLGLVTQKPAKRNSGTPPARMESPPVPKKIARMDSEVERSSRNNTRCSDVEFLKEMCNHAVPGKPY